MSGTTDDWIWGVLGITVKPFVEAVVNYETERFFASPFKYFESRGGTLGLLVNKTLQTVATTAVDLIPMTVEDNRTLKDIGSRLTIGGVLPNDPNFDKALQQKTDDLEEIFQDAMQNATQQQQGAMNLVDGALNLQGNNSTQITQGGKNKQMGSEEFHAAMMLGAHFVKQGRQLYDQLTQGGQIMGDKNKRTSSHYPGGDEPQYGLDLPEGLGHLLVGLTDNGDTFFQLESHGLGNPNMGFLEKLPDKVGHGMSYVQHITGGMNYVQIGPGGCIAGSEKDGQQVLLN